LTFKQPLRYDGNVKGIMRRRPTRSRLGPPQLDRPRPRGHPHESEALHIQGGPSVENGAVLVTYDRHFLHIDGLRLWEP